MAPGCRTLAWCPHPSQARAVPAAAAQRCDAPRRRRGLGRNAHAQTHRHSQACREDGHVSHTGVRPHAAGVEGGTRVHPSGSGAVSVCLPRGPDAADKCDGLGTTRHRKHTARQPHSRVARCRPRASHTAGRRRGMGRGEALHVTPPPPPPGAHAVALAHATRGCRSPRAQASTGPVSPLFLPRPPAGFPSHRHHISGSTPPRGAPSDGAGALSSPARHLIRGARAAFPARLFRPFLLFRLFRLLPSWSLSGVTGTPLIPLSVVSFRPRGPACPTSPSYGTISYCDGHPHPLPSQSRILFLRRTSSCNSDVGKQHTRVVAHPDQHLLPSSWGCLPSPCSAAHTRHVGRDVLQNRTHLRGARRPASGQRRAVHEQDWDRRPAHCQRCSPRLRQ